MIVYILFVLEHGVSFCREELLPLADIVTPNIREASALLCGARLETVADMHFAAKKIYELGCRSALETLLFQFDVML